MVLKGKRVINEAIRQELANLRAIIAYTRRRDEQKFARYRAELLEELEAIKQLVCEDER